MQPEYQQYQSPQQTPVIALWHRYKLQITFTLIVIFLGWFLYFIATHSFITVNLSGNVRGEQKIIILDQDRNTESSFTTTSASTRRFVRKSNYEVFVSGQGGSGWAQAASKSFLRNKVVSLELQSERARSFVADNPGGCMNYDQQLLSYTCGAATSGIVVHNQSSGSTPPLASRGLPSIDGVIKNIVNTPSGAIALIQQESEDEELPGLYYSFVSLASGTFEPSDQIYVSRVLSTEREYSMKAYKDGVVVYDDTYTDIFYFDSINSAGQRLKPPKVESELRAISIDSNSSSLIMHYSTTQGEDDTSASETAPGTRSAVIVGLGEPDVKTFYFTQDWSSALLCGSKKLCTTTSVGEKQQMIVFDISQNKPIKEFSVNNVNQLFSVGNDALAITDKGILRLNPTKRTGSVDYSFGEYSFCGTGSTRVASQYILCVTARDGNHVLLVDTTQVDTTQIDRKVEELRGTPGIDTVIVDRQRIFIVPDYGEPEYSEAEDGFIDNPAKVSSVNASIASSLQKLRFSELGFEIVDTN